MDIISSEFTADEFEQQLLDMGALDALEPDDPLYTQLAQISNQLSNLQTLITPKQRTIFPHLANTTLSTAEIAEKANASHHTVLKARKDPTIRRMLGLVERTQRLHSGPSQAQRLQMLWQIAKREQFNKPSISIKAVDTINKQVGDYSTGDTQQGGVVVNINEFKVVAPTEPVRDVLTQEPEVVDAVFTPVQVDVE